MKRLSEEQKFQKKSAGQLRYMKRKWGKDYQWNLYLCRLAMKDMGLTVKKVAKLEVELGGTKVLQMLYLVGQNLELGRYWTSVTKKLKKAK